MQISAESILEKLVFILLPFLLLGENSDLESKVVGEFLMLVLGKFWLFFMQKKVLSATGLY